MSTEMQLSWNIALDILKPKKIDLEHGLELHRNSLVIDGYGFTPVAALRSENLVKRFESAAPGEVNELATEARLTRCLTDDEEKQEFEEAWLQSGVSCVIANSGEEGQSPLRMLKRIAYRTELLDKNKKFFCKALCASDIEEAKKNGKQALMLTTNGVPLKEAWDSVGEELSDINIFYKLGVRMMHLTYNRRNMLGDGCCETSDAELSDFGRAAIRVMNETGVLVDVAHSGQRTSADAARTSGRPVVASHSSCHTINAHPRARTDETIRAIVDSGGYVGICCIPCFLGGKGDITSFLDHIDYLAKKFGTDHVAIGTDRTHTSSLSDDERITGILKRTRMPQRFENFWRPGEELFEKKWNEDRQLRSLAWTNFPLFTVGLVQRGYTDNDIQKILGGNILRVLNSL